MSPAKSPKSCDSSLARQARVAAVILFLGAALGGCSYQLGSLAGDDTTGSIQVRPLPKGQVDPNPNDPYKVDQPGKAAAAPASGYSG
jgi:hypothetical protein